MRGSRQSAVVVVALAFLLWVAGLTAPTGARAVTALIMGGTGQPHPERVTGYVDAVGRLYLDPVSSCKVSTCTLMPTYIPNEASPIYTKGMVFGDSVKAGTALLDAAVRGLLTQSEQIVVFGNSQSATVATEEIRALNADDGGDLSAIQVVLIGDPNRPNGGFLQRFYPFTVPVFDYTPHALPLSQIPVSTTDIAFQYDIAADFPRYPLNIFALLNTIVGIGIHGSYTGTHDGYTEAGLLAAINDPKNSRVVGNTTYITIPTKHLPLAQALRDVGRAYGLSAVLTPVADLLEPTLRVLVELGYDRSTPYGTQASFGLFPIVDPVKVVGDLGAAAVQGIHKVIGDVAGANRHAAIPAAAIPPRPPPSRRRARPIPRPPRYTPNKTFPARRPPSNSVRRPGSATNTRWPTQVTGRTT